jgi:transcriptional regulator with XRE-family HTH domain
VAERLPLYVAVGRAVKELRDERGLTQEALGFASGLDRTFVGAIERGERNLTMMTLEALAGGLEVDALQLVARATALQRGDS